MSISPLTRGLLDPVGERAYRTARQAILRGEIEGGTRLVETQLAAQIGVSRTPVREAIRRLAQEGLVELVPRGGAVVKVVTAEDIISAYDCRAVLEGLVGRLASERRSHRDLLDLSDIQRQAHETLARRRLEEIFAVNTQFHEALARMANNSLLHAMLGHLTFYVTRYRQIILQAAEQHSEARDWYLKHVVDIINEHDELVHLIEARKGEDAESLLRFHVLNTARVMASILDLVRERQNASGRRRTRPNR